MFSCFRSNSPVSAFSEMHERHPKSSDAMETTPPPPIFILILVQGTIILKRVKFHEDDMRKSDSDVTL